MRYQRLLVPAQFFVVLCRDGFSGVCAVTANGLPEDAQFVYVIGGTTRAQYFELVVWSASFHELAEGDEIPELPSPRFQKLTVDPHAEGDLRAEWFTHHGCPSRFRVRSDTGAMICTNEDLHAPADFTHAPIAELRDLVTRTRLHFTAVAIASTTRAVQH